MTFLQEVVNFLQTRNSLELLALFWYFLIFDFTRYIVFDAIVLSVYFWRRPRVRREKQAARAVLFHERPLVTIIAVGKDEAPHIPTLIDSISRQTYRNLEVIVVDDGSEDDTPEICRQLQQKGLITKFLRNPIRGGKASAANLALRYATGKFVVHMDADSHLKHDSIEQIIIPFYWKQNVGAVAGDLRVYNVTDGLATQLQTIEYMEAISTGRTVNSLLGINRMVSGAYGAFRKDILDRVKGWDVGPGLDGDLTAKVRKLHYYIHFEPESVCYTSVPQTFTGLARQRLRWDRSLIRFRLRKHKDILIPDANFSWYNFFSSAENIFFNLILDFKWWIYFLQIVFFFTEFLQYVLVINYILYLIANYIEYLFVLGIYQKTRRREELLAVFFMPLKPIYTGFYLRTVRTYAYLMEFFFRISYADSWNPWKSSKIAEKEGL